MKKLKLRDGHIVFVDDEDFPRVSNMSWHAARRHRMWYAIHQNRHRKVNIYMHRFILNLPPYHPFLDHKNGNGLDNRKRNLRICSHAQNMRNSKRYLPKKNSKFRGVFEISGRWRACLLFNGLKIWTPQFYSERDAALARDALAIAYHAEFSKLNFPKSTLAQRKAAWSRQHVQAVRRGPPSRLNFPKER